MNLNSEEKQKVIMIGPDRSVHGGISGVVNTYYEAGLERYVDIKYIGTMKEGSKLYKLWVAICAYIQFVFCVNGYDIVHVHAASDRSFERKSYFVRTAFRKKKKIILHQHGGDFINWYASLSAIKQNQVKQILDMADKMLVLAPNWKEYFGGLTDANKIEVFPNSIQIPEEYEKDYSALNILFLGRICEAKGINELIDASKVIADKYPDAKIKLGGIWEDKALEKRIASECTNIEYLGWISGEEKQKELQNVTIFVMPSHFEGQCISIVEAMAQGCAVVASNTGGIPMMIQNGITGLLVEPKSAESLTAGLEQVLADERLRKKLGTAAREVVWKEYNITNTITKLIQIYTSI